MTELLLSTSLIIAALYTWSLKRRIDEMSRDLMRMHTIVNGERTRLDDVKRTIWEHRSEDDRKIGEHDERIAAIETATALLALYVHPVGADGEGDWRNRVYTGAPLLLDDDTVRDVLPDVDAEHVQRIYRKLRTGCGMTVWVDDDKRVGRRFIWTRAGGEQ